jgi:4-alpha-glucanotransferase
MDLKELNEKEESFQRSDKAIQDGYLEYRRKSRKWLDDYADFAKIVQSEGYVLGVNGWEKEEGE